jgi:adenosylmethionine-8-amino-7-oxononanoate aminotransferase
MATDEIIETIASGSGEIMAGHTYSANPQSAAISLAVLTYIEQHGLIAQAAEQGAYLLSGMKQLAAELPLIGEARGLGMLCGMEFVKDKTSKEAFSLTVGVASRVIAKCLEKGLIVYPAIGGLDGTGGDSIIIAPPFVITKEEIDELLATLKEAVIDVHDELQRQGLLQ